jgi:hypothetical protein
MHNSWKAIGMAALLVGMAGCGSGGSDGGIVTPAKTVAVKDAGGDNAWGFKSTYNVAYGQSGEYTYTISNFDKDDKLVFPAGNAISVDNESFTDGQVKLTCTSNTGSKVTVILTNLTPQQDKVVSVSDLNQVFGAGAVVQQ